MDHPFERSPAPAARQGALPQVRIEASAELPSEFGRYRLVVFSNDRDGKEHVAMVHGDVDGFEHVPVRMHSECLTGDVLGSLRCDCRPQLERALRVVGEGERGVVLYLRQEGRGIGLTNKIKAYGLQEQGLDTVEANLALGFPDDARDYGVAAAMLRALGVRSVALLTNNPLKVRALEEHGLNVRRVAHAIPPGQHNRRYLATKVRRSGHLIPVEDLAEEAAE